jgi:hypothetical protein
MTGARYTGLSTRYGRIKAAITRVDDDDLDALKEAVEEEKKQAEKKKWGNVAELMESKGAKKYDAATLEKTWKRIQSGDKDSSS